MRTGKCWGKVDSAEVNCLFWGEVDSAGVRYKGCILNILKHQKTRPDSKDEDEGRLFVEHCDTKVKSKLVTGSTKSSRQARFNNTSFAV